MKPETIRAWEEALYEKAKTQIKVAEDGKFSRMEIREKIADQIKIDERREQLQRADAIIKERGKPSGTEPGPLLAIMGDVYRDHPRRLVINGDAVCELNDAHWEDRHTEDLRKLENAMDRMKEAQRSMKATEIHRVWAERQRALGRPPLDLTWANCKTEEGLIKK